MDEQIVEDLRRALIDRGRALLRRRIHALADERELLEERETDWEDQAAGETAAAVLGSLSDAEGMTLARIQASLERMARGTYGECVVCHGSIDEERLRAVPEAERCAGCTNAH